MREEAKTLALLSERVTKVKSKPKKSNSERSKHSSKTQTTQRNKSKVKTKRVTSAKNARPGKVKKKSLGNVRVTYNIETCKPRRMLPENISLDQKPEKQKESVTGTTARTRNLVSSRKICAKPGCTEIVTGTYCTALCQRLHLDMVAPKIKPENNDGDRGRKEVFRRDNVTSSLPAMVDLIKLLSYCLRTVYLASRNK